ncbi:MAG: AlpA family phage regulatory protein [Proteobacteria bacterium]|nr:AlpA family phage regulatory protein [Pseudomonadota bacterium]
MTVLPNSLMNVTQVAQQLGVGKSTIWRWCKQGTFPRPIKLSERVSRWRPEDVAAVIMHFEATRSS